MVPCAVGAVVSSVTLVAALVAAATAKMVFRLKGGYFAVGTWVVAEVIRIVMSNVSMLGGGSGQSLTVMARLPRELRESGTYWIACALLIGSSLAINLLLRSRFGMALTAVRDSETAAESQGVDVAGLKFRVYVLSALGSGLVLLTAGVVAGMIAVLAKWAVVGRIRAVEHPLWSSFVWRNEVSDTFVETVAAPWFARAASGTPVMNVWLRGLGAKIGRGVWCETYWLPEADLVTLERASTVNRGCVVQTHLFHDRIMRMDTVVLEAGATLGTHCVALPAARLGAGATVGPASLVMRGDEVPANTRWQGNPIAPWADSRKKRGSKAGRGAAA